MPPDIAERQDYAKCMNILAMRAYDDVLSREERGEKLSGRDYKLIIPMERAAGIEGGVRVFETRG